MARTSRGKGSRSAGTWRAKRKTGGAAKKASARGRSAARGPTKSKASAAKSRAGAAKRATAGGGAEVAKLKALEREKSGLEKRLTESVREIGQLRHHEARAGQLERQLKERDDTITKLRAELSELRRRPPIGVDDPDAQPSLALGERAPRDLDDFDDEIPIDDDDELV